MKIIREHIEFERGKELYKALDIGRDRQIRPGDEIWIFNYYTGEMQLVKATTDVATIDDIKVVDILIGKDDWYAAWNEDADRWELGET